MDVLGRAVLCFVALGLLAILAMFAFGQDKQVVNTESSNGTGTISVTLPSTDVCGKRGSRFKRIIGGSDATPGMFPWIAALGYKSSEDSSIHWLADASLVTDRHLVTVSYGIVKYGGVRYVLNVVRLGILDLNDTEAARTGDYEVDTLTRHPGYSYTKIIDHISIIKLKKKVTFSRFIQPICLPTLSEFRTNDFAGSTGYIAGWGSTESGRDAVRLQHAQVRVWDQEKCKKVYEGRKGAIIDNKVFCAVGDDGSDTCQGDDPLMMPYGPDSNYYLFGVASYGSTCGDPLRPAVYTRVSEYMDWILLNLK